jgi:hypothetical protein
MFSFHMMSFVKEIKALIIVFTKNSIVYLQSPFFSKIIFLTLFLLLILLSCKENPTTPCEQPKPPGYQEDIPWPSLADSPWPMRHADPQSTGRSKSCGPKNGTVDFTITDNFLNSEPVVSHDSILYIAFQDSLFAFRLNHQVLWKIKLGGENVVTPIVNSNCIVFVSYDQGGIYSINKTGTTLWNLNTSGFDAQLNIGIDGTIYTVSTDRNLTAISPIGAILWQKFDGNFYGGSNISFSPDGNTIYITGSQHTLAAFDILSKKIKWMVGDTNYRGAPLVDSKGNIYLSTKIDTLNDGKYGLYCFQQDGNVRWFFPHSQFSNLPGEGIWNFHGEPAIDTEGNIIFGQDTVYSLSYAGELRWKKRLNISSSASISLDNEGNIFLIKDAIPSGFSILALNKNGNPLWQIENLQGESTASSSIILNDMLIVPTQDKYIYIIK